MRAESVFRCGRSLFSNLLVISALLLTIGVRPSLAAGEQDVREQDSKTIISGWVMSVFAQPHKDILVRCSSFEDHLLLGETLSGENGEFELNIPPIAAKKIQCSIDGGATYEADEKIIQAGRSTKVVFTLKIRTIELVAWIQAPKDWEIKEIDRALVRVVYPDGMMISRRPDPDGGARFNNLRPGKADVEYSFEGLGKMTRPVTLAMGSDLSASLRYDWFPSALILLIPGILVLGVLAGMSWRWPETSRTAISQGGTPREDPDTQRRVGDLALMLASLLLWGLRFPLLWLLLRERGGGGLHFFHPRLSFSLAVPIFGFVGALIFVIDLLRTRSQAVPAYREFALRLVLGPYVAIVMVLLFGETFEIINLNKLSSQATVAFFSGFLVVLVLQSLAEKGNEALGQWRATSRYEPSEIARQFNLHVEEDVKLQKANLKYLEQLRALSKDELRTMAKQTELGEGFLGGLQKRLREGDLVARLGQETWTKLNQEGIRTVGDVAFLSPERIQQIATNQQIDREALTAFSEACKKTFAQDP